MNYRYQDFGRSADRPVRRNMMNEDRPIRIEHGTPKNEILSRLTRMYALMRSRWLKLICRRKIDLVSGTWKLRKHLRGRRLFPRTSAWINSSGSEP